MLMYIKPYLPYIDYYINKAYIAENLCENKEKPQLKCHGQCHLKKELEKATETEQESPILPSQKNKKDTKQQLNLFAEELQENSLFFSGQKVHFFYQQTTSEFVQQFIIPPPQQLV